MKLHWKKKNTFIILTVAVLALLVFLLVWNQMGDNDVETELRYSPTEDEFQVVITRSEAGDFQISVTIDSAEAPLAPGYGQRQMSVSKLSIKTAEKEYALNGQYSQETPIEDGKWSLTIPVSAVPAEDCQLVITEFVIQAKADVPLYIDGSWESNWTYSH